MLAGAEAGTVLLLLLMAAWQFWGWAAPPSELEAAAHESLGSRMPSFGSSEVMIALLMAAAAYTGLQLVGRSRVALWFMAALTLLPQAPGVWAHNNLAWERFTGASISVGEGHSIAVAGALFLASLVGLFFLHRVIALRRLDQLLATRRVDDLERTATLTNEGLSLSGIAGLAVLLSIVLVSAGTLLGQWESLTSIVPWTVVTIGGGATLLLIAFIALFLRGVTGQEERESSAGD